MTDPNILHSMIAELERMAASEHQLLADIRRLLQQQTHSTRVPPDLQQIVDAQPGPARIVDRYYRVLAQNAIDRKLEGRDIVGHNAAHIVLGAEARAGYIPQMEHLAGLIADILHANLDRHPDDQELRKLINSLRTYPHFDVLWPGRTKTDVTGYLLTRISPLDGADLTLDYATVAVHGWPGSRLLTGMPRGKSTRARLDRLIQRLGRSWPQIVAVIVPLPRHV